MFIVCLAPGKNSTIYRLDGGLFAHYQFILNDSQWNSTAGIISNNGSMIVYGKGNGKVFIYSHDISQNKFSFSHILNNHDGAVEYI